MTRVIFYTSLIFSFWACKTRSVFIPVESVRTEYIDHHLHDSVYLHDSVFIHQLNDTIWMEKYKTIYRERLLRDSVVLCDTIRVPYPVIETHEVNKLHSWQVILMCLGGVLIGIIGYKIVRWLKGFISR